MKALLQRVSRARVVVAGQVVGEIERGLVTFLGIEVGDTEASVEKVITKILDLRVFEDGAGQGSGKMNISLRELAAQGLAKHLIVSQFTLAADYESGRRPSFTRAEKPERAKALYEYALAVSRNHGVATESGQFQTHMQVELTNDGPATFWIDGLTV